MVLNNDQNTVLLGRDEDLVLLRLDPEKSDIVRRVKLTNHIPGFHTQTTESVGVQACLLSVHSGPNRVA